MALNQQDIELNQRLKSLTDSFANGNISLQNTLREQTRRMIGAQDEVIDEYANGLDKVRSWTSAEAKQVRERLIRLKKIESDRDGILKASMMREKKVRDDITKLQQKHAEVERKANAVGIKQSAKDRFTHELAELSNKIAQATDERTALRASSMAAAQTMRNAAAERQRLEYQQLNKTAEWGDKIRDGISKGAMGAIKGMFGDASLSSSLKNVGLQAKDAIIEGMRTGGYGIGVTGDSKFNVNTMAKFGFNPAEAVKMQAEQRRAIISSNNGITGFVDGLTAANEEFRDQIADPLERSQVAIDSFNIAVNSGIKMEASQATMFKANMKKFSIVTGETGTTFTKHISNIMESEEVQANLRQLSSEQERKAVLDGIQAQYTQNRAMGMTSDQAIKTAKHLASLGTKKGKTTIQDAARINALAGTMGMGDLGARQMQLAMKRNTRTAAENDEYKRILADIRNEADRRSGGAVGGMTMSMEGIMDGLKTDENLPSLLNDSLAKAVAPQQDILDKTLPQISDDVKKVTSSLFDMKMILDKGPLGQIGVGAAGSLVGSLLGSGGGSFAGTLLGRMIPGLGGAAGGAAAGGGALLSGVAATAAAAAAMLGVGAGIDHIAGKMGVGSNTINEDQDRANWDRMGTLEKIESGLGRTIESVGSLVFLDNLANEARSDRIANETNYLNKKEKIDASITGPARKPDPSPEEQKTIDEQKKIETDNSKRLETMTNTLKEISETNQKQLDMSEKQLIALTMTEQERAIDANRMNLRRDNRFGSSYGYVT